jgi:hypothetical protein
MLRRFPYALWLVVACAPASKERAPVRVVRAEAPNESDGPAEIATGPPAAEPPGRVAGNPFLGRWTGIGEQDDQETWEMVVTIRSTDAGQCATVEYPGIPCSGIWECAGLSADGQLGASERLVEGRGRCIDNGTMTMRVTSDDTLDWSWEGGGGVHAHATLQRAK